MLSSATLFLSAGVMMLRFSLRSLSFLVLGSSLLLSSCSHAPEVGDVTPVKPEFKPVKFTDLNGWSQDGSGDALKAFLLSCSRISGRPASEAFGAEAIMGTVAEWQDLCVKAQSVPSGDHLAARRFFENGFQPYEVDVNGKPDGLFTGYYEAALHGSLRRSARYSVPLRERPSDLVMVNLGEFRPELKGQRIAGRVTGGTLKPYEDRSAIENGKLPKDMDKPLVWVDSAVDAFFLHIQGSGAITLDDGSIMRVGYDGQNGHIYTAIGKELIARGELTKENVSMQTIREWLAKHPDEADKVMDVNRSYIFFRTLDTNGPVGAQGVVLTPERSLAVDPVFWPYGLPVYLSAEAPDTGETAIERLMIAQDTGGAIKGPVRGDFFWGYGDRAARLAGLMKSRGRAIVLLPKAASMR